MHISATFICRDFKDGYTTLICNETGERYSFAERQYEPFPIFREGAVMAYRRGRAGAIACIESDAKWQIRDDLRKQRAAQGKRSTVWA